MQYLNQYNTLWKIFIRPPRDTYQKSLLGNNLLKVENQLIQRKDLELYNNKYEKLHCSHFQLVEDSGNIIDCPCIVYLHCNGSNRLEALPIMKKLAINKIQMFCFDFAGCGNSEGEYITLGQQESKDLEIIINYLKSQDIKQIGLWGRSMGASTAILYGFMDRSIQGLLIDSAFCDLELIQLIQANYHMKLLKVILIYLNLLQIQFYQ